jgi:hypothetical protein
VQKFDKAFDSAGERKSHSSGQTQVLPGYRAFAVVINKPE